MFRLIFGMILLLALIAGAGFYYFHLGPEGQICSQAVKQALKINDAFSVRFAEIISKATGQTVNLVFDVKGLGNYYSCDLAKDADGSLLVVRVFPTPAP